MEAGGQRASFHASRLGRGGGGCSAGTASHDPGISAADDEELLGRELEYGHLAEAVRQLSCSTSRHAGDDEALLAPATIRRAAEARHRAGPGAPDKAHAILLRRSVR